MSQASVSACGSATDSTKMRVEYLRAIRAVEASDVGILVGLAWLEERHTVVRAPVHERLRGDSGPLSTRIADGRTAVQGHEGIEFPRGASTWQGEPDRDLQTFSVVPATGAAHAPRRASGQIQS